MTKDICELTPINIIEGEQEHKILFNLVSMMKKLKKKIKKKTTENKRDNKLVIALKAILNFMMMMAIQFIKV